MDRFTVIAALDMGIALAYVVMATRLAPRLGLPRAGRLAAIAFFLACAYGQVALALDALRDRHEHAVTSLAFAVAVVQLVVGWWLVVVLVRRLEVRIASRLPRRAAARLLHRRGDEAGWTWSARRDRLHASPELARIAGRPEPWTPRLEGLLALVVPEEREDFEARVRALRRADGPVQLECRIRRTDGSVRHLRTRLVSTRARVVGVTEDVTQEREVAAARAVAEREHRIAQTLQRSLLPAQLPHVPALELAAQYLPGGDGNEVGGDWYDVIRLADGDVVLVMGDVVGRGIPAAALVGKLRNALRAYVVEGHPPEDALERLNALVDRPAQEMATVLVARFRPSSGVVRFASAGHLPPLLRRADGTRLFLDGGRCVPLGALGHVVFEADEATLAPGDTLMLFTDGLVERRGVPLDESLEALRVAAPASGDAVELCDAAVEALLPEGTDADDVAVLTARVRAVTPEDAAAALALELEALA